MNQGLIITIVIVIIVIIVAIIGVTVTIFFAIGIFKNTHTDHKKTIETHIKAYEANSAHMPAGADQEALAIAVVHESGITGASMITTYGKSYAAVNKMLTGYVPSEDFYTTLCKYFSIASGVSASDAVGSINTFTDYLGKIFSMPIVDFFKAAAHLNETFKGSDVSLAGIPIHVLARLFTGIQFDASYNMKIMMAIYKDLVKASVGAPDYINKYLVYGNARPFMIFPDLAAYFGDLAYELAPKDFVDRVLDKRLFKGNLTALYNEFGIRYSRIAIPTDGQTRAFAEIKKAMEEAAEATPENTQFVWKDSSGYTPMIVNDHKIVYGTEWDAMLEQVKASVPIPTSPFRVLRRI